MPGLGGGIALGGAAGAPLGRLGPASLVALTAGLFTCTAPGDLPRPRARSRLPPRHGALRGTPHYWVADETGPSALGQRHPCPGGRYVRWTVREVTPEALEALPRGEAWLPLAGGLCPRRRPAVPGGAWRPDCAGRPSLRVPSVEALRFLGSLGGGRRCSIDRETVSGRGCSSRAWRPNLTPVARCHLPRPPLRRGWRPVAVRPGYRRCRPERDRAPLAAPGASWVLERVGAQRSPALSYPVSVTLTRPALDPALGVVVGTISYPRSPAEASWA